MLEPLPIFKRLKSDVCMKFYLLASVLDDLKHAGLL